MPAFLASLYRPMNPMTPSSG